MLMFNSACICMPSLTCYIYIIINNLHFWWVIFRVPIFKMIRTISQRKRPTDLIFVVLNFVIAPAHIMM